MARIVILGGSFGGLTAAFELKRLLGKMADITLLSDYVTRDLIDRRDR